MNHEDIFVILESFIFHSFEGIHWNIFCWDRELCPPSLMVSVISHKKSVWFYFKHVYCPVLLNFVSLQGFLVKQIFICYICVTVAFCPSSFFPRIGGQQPVHERSTPTFHTYLPIHRLSSFSVPRGSVFINSPWILARVGQIQHWLAVLFLMSQLTVLPNQYFHKITCNLPCYLPLAIHSPLFNKTYGNVFFPWLHAWNSLKGNVRIVNELLLLEIKKNQAKQEFVNTWMWLGTAMHVFPDTPSLPECSWVIQLLLSCL